MTYHVAIQNLYGQWTPWQAIDDAMTQPDLEQVRIVSVDLEAQPLLSGSICPASVVIEFLWDWSVRSPQLIRFAGLLYPAAEHGSPPPGTVVPGGFARSLGGGDAFLEVTFAADTPSRPGPRSSA